MVIQFRYHDETLCNPWAEQFLTCADSGNKEILVVERIQMVECGRIPQWYYDLHTFTVTHNSLYRKYKDEYYLSGRVRNNDDEYNAIRSEIGERLLHLLRNFIQRWGVPRVSFTIRRIVKFWQEHFDIIPAALGPVWVDFVTVGSLDMCLKCQRHLKVGPYNAVQRFVAPLDMHLQSREILRAKKCAETMWEF
jgi:hypothetical protein